MSLIRLFSSTTIAFKRAIKVTEPFRVNQILNDYTLVTELNTPVKCINKGYYYMANCKNIWHYEILGCFDEARKLDKTGQYAPEITQGLAEMAYKDTVFIAFEEEKPVPFAVAVEILNTATLNFEEFKTLNLKMTEQFYGLLDEFNENSLPSPEQLVTLLRNLK